MQDFNEFANSGKKGNSGEDLNSDIFNLISSLSGKFDGKSQNELMRAVYDEAKRGKKNGTLKNSDIDNFVSMLSPILDDDKRKMLYKIANELKKI